VEVLKVHFVEDWWNILDMLLAVWTPTILIMMGTLALSGGPHKNGELRHLYRSIAAQGAMTLVLQYWRCLYYLRPFRTTGPIVKMIMSVLDDMKVFFGVFLMLCWAVYASLRVIYDAHVLPGIEASESISDTTKITPAFVLSKIASLSIGEFDRTLGTRVSNDLDEEVGLLFEDSLSATVGELINAFSIFMITIVLTNLLVAVLSDSHARISENNEEEFLRERATTIAKIEEMMSDAELTNTTYFPDYIHYLYPREVLLGQVDDDGWRGSINRLKKIIGGNTAQLTQVQGEQRVLRREVRSLQRRMGTVASGVSQILKEVQKGVG